MLHHRDFISMVEEFSESSDESFCVDNSDSETQESDSKLDLTAVEGLEEVSEESDSDEENSEDSEDSDDSDDDDSESSDDSEDSDEETASDEEYNSEDDSDYSEEDSSDSEESEDEDSDEDSEDDSEAEEESEEDCEDSADEADEVAIMVKKLKKARAENAELRSELDKKELLDMFFFFSTVLFFIVCGTCFYYRFAYLLNEVHQASLPTKMLTLQYEHLFSDRFTELGKGMDLTERLKMMLEYGAVLEDKMEQIGALVEDYGK